MRSASDNLETEGEESLLITDVDFTTAKEAELLNWQKHNVFEEVDDIGQQCISTRWVCTLKESESGVQQKARLVVKGFEECLDEIHKNSPTCNKQSLRLNLSIIACKKWKERYILNLQKKHILLEKYGN